MGMPDLMRHWTRDEVLALPDDGMRHELFDGELVVTPAPAYRHPEDLRPEILQEGVTWQPLQGTDPLVIELAGLFAPPPWA